VLLQTMSFMSYKKWDFTVFFEGHLISRYLAITAGPTISISSTYVLFLTEMQKGKSSEMNLPLL